MCFYIGPNRLHSYRRLRGVDPLRHNWFWLAPSRGILFTKNPFLLSLCHGRYLRAYDLGVVDQLEHLVVHKVVSAGIATQVEDMNEVHPMGVGGLLLKSIISQETRKTIYSYDVRGGDHAS